MGRLVPMLLPIDPGGGPSRGLEKEHIVNIYSGPRWLWIPADIPAKAGTQGQATSRLFPVQARGRLWTPAFAGRRGPTPVRIS